MKLKLKQTDPELVAAAHDESVRANRRRKRPRHQESAFLTSPMADKLWNPDYCNELIRFYDRESWRSEARGKYGDAEAVISDKPPSLARFALHVGATLPIVKRWLALYPAFAEAYETAVGLEESYFIETGAAGISPGFAAAKLGFNKAVVAEEKRDEPITEIKIVVDNGPNRNQTN